MSLSWSDVYKVLDHPNTDNFEKVRAWKKEGKITENCEFNGVPLLFRVLTSRRWFKFFLGEMKVSPNIVDEYNNPIITHSKTECGGVTFMLEPKIIKTLIKYGVNVNQVDTEGNSVVHLACRFANYKVLSVLLKSSFIDWNLKNNEGHTPVEVAIKYHGNDASPKSKGLFNMLMLHFENDLNTLAKLIPVQNKLSGMEYTKPSIINKCRT